MLIATMNLVDFIKLYKNDSLGISYMKNANFDSSPYTILTIIFFDNLSADTFKFYIFVKNAPNQIFFGPKWGKNPTNS